MRMRKREEGLRTCTTSSPVSWHASAAYLPLRDLLTLSEEGSDSASMRRGGATHYVKIGGAGGVHKSSAIYKGRGEQKPKVNKGRAKQGGKDDDHEDGSEGSKYIGATRVKAETKRQDRKRERLKEGE
jgi:hypothetical protein